MELLVGVGVVGGGVLSFWAGVWVWRVGWGWRLWGVGGLVVGGWLGRLVWATRGEAPQVLFLVGYEGRGRLARGV